MIAMVIMRTKDPKVKRVRRFVVGEITCKHDMSGVLKAKAAFMKEQNTAMKNTVDGKRFVVTKTTDGRLGSSFNVAAQVPILSVLVDVTTRMFVCGDLAFYAVILGREHMSGKLYKSCNASNERGGWIWRHA